MSEMQNSINSVKTMNQQNAELTYQNSCMMEMIASDYAESNIAKHKIVDAINLAGGNASINNSLAELADILTSIMSNGVPMTGGDGEMAFDESAGVIDSAMSIIRNWSKMTKYVDKYTTRIPNYGLSQLNGKEMHTNARYVEFTNATESGYNCFFSFPYQEELILPNLIKDSAGFSNSRFAFKNLRRLYMPKMQSFPGVPWYNEGEGCGQNLIDITIGGGSTGGKFDFKYIVFANVVTDSANLLTPQDILDGFSTNKQKFLWNLRNHFAALLGETTSGQIIFHANVYNILDEETTTAFTSKGWTISTP